ncbi:MAG TPA: flagellar protein FliS [bacterium]|nr:flagellar protein FliS [bacterium]
MSSSIDAYRSIDVTTSNPHTLVLRAFDAAISALEEAESALGGGADHEAALHRAQTIVFGLMSALNFDAGDLAQRLLQHYLFVIDRIHRTLLERADQGVREARAVLTELRSGWSQMKVEESAPRPAAGPPSGIRVRG